MELRCAAKLHGILEGEFVEIKCGSKFCGAKPGVVVLHRFNLHTGALVETRKYQDPAHLGRSASGHRNERAALRTP